MWAGPQHGGFAHGPGAAAGGLGWHFTLTVDDTHTGQVKRRNPRKNARLKIDGFEFEALFTMLNYLA